MDRMSKNRKPLFIGDLVKDSSASEFSRGKIGIITEMYENAQEFSVTGLSHPGKSMFKYTVCRVYCPGLGAEWGYNMFADEFFSREPWELTKVS